MCWDFNTQKSSLMLSVLWPACHALCDKTVTINLSLTLAGLGSEVIFKSRGTLALKHARHVYTFSWLPTDSGIQLAFICIWRTRNGKSCDNLWWWSIYLFFFKSKILHLILSILFVLLNVNSPSITPESKFTKLTSTHVWKDFVLDKHSTHR